jgi:hypothetical protein
MRQALQGIEPWQILAAVAALVAFVLLQVWRARRRRQRIAGRELNRMQRELAIREQRESGDQSDLW